MDGDIPNDLIPDFAGLAPPVAPAASGPGAGPYAGLPPGRFWRSGMAETDPLAVEGLYTRRFPIAATDRIVTAGGCFARHVAAPLRARGFTVFDVELAPWGFEPARAQAFGYGVQSARLGDIHSARQLLELLREAMAPEPPAPIVREAAGRFYDALRPGVEPEGLGSPEEVAAHRADHLARVRRMFRKADVFIFTFGMTEAWRDRATGRTLPVAPGAVAFDSTAHAFHNFTAAEILEDYRAFRTELAAVNPQVRHLVSVAPAPLAATAEDRHVLLASTYSKSVLRAVAGQLYAECPDLDYFPAYEIVASPWSRGLFFAPDQRSVSRAGVAAMLRAFFAEHGSAAPARPGKDGGTRPDEDVVCEEILLEAFGA